MNDYQRGWLIAGGVSFEYEKDTVSFECEKDTKIRYDGCLFFDAVSQIYAAFEEFYLLPLLFAVSLLVLSQQKPRTAMLQAVHVTLARHAKSK